MPEKKIQVTLNITIDYNRFETKELDIYKEYYAAIQVVDKHIKKIIGKKVGHVQIGDTQMLISLDEIVPDPEN